MSVTSSYLKKTLKNWTPLKVAVVKIDFVNRNISCSKIDAFGWGSTGVNSMIRSIIGGYRNTLLQTRVVVVIIQCRKQSVVLKTQLGLCSIGFRMAAQTATVVPTKRQLGVDHC